MAMKPPSREQMLLQAARRRTEACLAAVRCAQIEQIAAAAAAGEDACQEACATVAAMQLELEAAEAAKEVVCGKLAIGLTE